MLIARWMIVRTILEKNYKSEAEKLLAMLIRCWIIVIIEVNKPEVVSTTQVYALHEEIELLHSHFDQHGTNEAHSRIPLRISLGLIHDIWNWICWSSCCARSISSRSCSWISSRKGLYGGSCCARCRSRSYS